MHSSSLKLMKSLLATCSGKHAIGMSLYDVGSMDINGSYKPMCIAEGWSYTGLDIAPGKNVDIVIDENKMWGDDLSPVGLVISGQCIEHTKKPWQWIKQVASLLIPSGKLVLIAPASWPQHRHPVDCYRFMPDGFEALAEEANLRVIITGLSNSESYENYLLEDCYGVFEK